MDCDAHPRDASVALRKLVDQARQYGGELKPQVQERAYRIMMMPLAGNEIGYKEEL